MDFWFYIPCVAAIVGGTCIFAFSPKLHNFQKSVGFTFVSEGLTVLRPILNTKTMDRWVLDSLL